jgi:uncharacterized protein YbjT (DUF2867 family)
MRRCHRESPRWTAGAEPCATLRREVADSDPASPAPNRSPAFRLSPSDSLFGMGVPGRTVLVTGATGTVGRYVVDRLVEDGVPVTRAVHDVAGFAEEYACRFDFADSSTWGPALEGVDRVFLMRPPAISDIKGVIRPFIAELGRRGIRQTVVLSVMGVNPAMPHYRLEQDVKAAGLPATMLRPAFFMQNLETVYRDDIHDRDRIRLPAGAGKTSFIDTRDVAEVAVAALAEPDVHAGHAYTLTGGAALNWNAVASLLSAELRRPISYEPISLITARRELRAADFPAAYVNIQLLIHVVARLGLADTVNTEIARILGRAPRTLADYVHDTRHVWIRE